MAEKPVLIDIEDYIYSGEGANGACYFHRSDPTIMLKMARADLPSGLMEMEINSARLVYSLGIPTPKPGNLVTDAEGRIGVQFERIQDKKSFSRAVADEPDRVDEFARRFAGMCLKLHSTEVPVDKVPDAKKLDLDMLRESPFFEPEERARVEKFILSIPDARTAIHGDLQYGNAIMSSKGDFFIDLADFSYGHPYLDLGMVYLCCCFSPDDFIRETYHMEPELTRKFWRCFVRAYFGESSKLEEVEKTLRPYAGLKVLIIERNMNAPFPIFHRLFDGLTD